jgi:hypothetical protein
MKKVGWWSCLTNQKTSRFTTVKEGPIRAIIGKTNNLAENFGPAKRREKMEAKQP